MVLANGGLPAIASAHSIQHCESRMSCARANCLSSNPVVTLHLRKPVTLWEIALARPVNSGNMDDNISRIQAAGGQ